MRAATTLFALLMLTAVPDAQSLDQVLAQLRAYLTTYEHELGALVADEDYVQQVFVGGRGLGVRVPEVRRLESTVSFLRLPGGAEWLGLREVTRVNRKRVDDSNRLITLLSSKDESARAQAARIAQSSAAHNLGSHRTINMPVLPLELLHPRNHRRMRFAVGADDQVRGTLTTRLSFVETGVPTLIVGADGRSVITRGEAWVERNTGAVWRATVFYRDYADRNQSDTPQGEIRVEFARNEALAVIVPSEMRETFPVVAGRGDGHAKYSNYRRFTTSARIVPQP